MAGSQWIYFIWVSYKSIVFTKRVGERHRNVFHGELTFAEPAADGNPRTVPRRTNSDRRTPHLTRSGTFLPAVFTPGPRADVLVVSTEVREQLAALAGIEFLPCPFDQAVVLDMPPLGDNEPEFVKPDYASLPAMNIQPETIDEYHYLLMPTSGGLLEDFEDFQEIAPDAGSYPGPQSPRKCNVSMDALHEYEICVVGRCIALTEAAFSVLGKYLDLDYYGVATLDLRKRITLEDITGYTREELLKRNEKNRAEKQNRDKQSNP